MMVHLVAPLFHPRVGGMEKALCRLAAGLTSRGASVVVLTTPECAPEPGAGYALVAAGSPALTIWAAALAGLADQLGPPDVAIFSTLPADMAEGLLAAAAQYRARGIRTVLRVPTDDHLERHLGRDRVDRAVRHFDRVVCLSPSLAATLSARGHPAVAIPNGVDLVEHRPPAPDGRAGASVLFRGRVARRKNLRVLLDVKRALGAAVEVTVQGAPSYGEDDYFHAFAREASACGVTLRPAAWEGGGELYRTHSIAMLPSAAEGCSNFLLEGMASGMVGVCSDIPANAAVVGDAGILCSRPEDYVRAIIGLRDDVGLLRSLGVRARARVEEHYAFSTSLDCWESALTAVCRVSAPLVER